jgi:serine/threonine protein kinase
MTTPRLLSERYELGETLGYGGMSEVHRGLDTRLGRDVAIKVLRADLARDPQFQMRFRRGRRTPRRSTTRRSWRCTTPAK